MLLNLEVLIFLM